MKPPERAAAERTLTSVLRGGSESGSPIDGSWVELMDVCDEHDVTGLVHRALTARSPTTGCPDETLAPLARKVRVPLDRLPPRRLVDACVAARDALLRAKDEDDDDAVEKILDQTGLPDSLAYYRFLGLDPAPELLEALGRLRYRKVFILSLLPLHRDYARTEDPDAQRRIHDLLLEVYSALPIPLVQVPAVGPEERADFILARL